MRCKTLADLWRDRGAEVRFVCRELRGNLSRLLEAADYVVGRLPCPDPGQRMALHNEYALSLGVEASVDAAQTIEALGGFSPDWLVVDHYALDAGWERLLRAHTRQLLVIDDLANRPHDCDILLDQNWFGNETEHRYDRLVSAGCTRLLGPRYALLPPVFRDLRQALPSRDGAIRRVLVFFGGVDSGNQTTKALQALSMADLCDLEALVVVGSSNAHAADIERLAEARPHTLLFRHLPHLAGLMVRADLALGAGGATTWERCCLGLPGIVVAAAANQLPFTIALAKAGVQAYLGTAAEVQESHWAVAVRNLRKRPQDVQAYGQAAKGMTDGLGACRVAAVMQPELVRLSLQRPSREHASLLQEWAGDRIADDFETFVVQNDQRLPLGWIRLGHHLGDILVDLRVDRSFHGRGLEEALLRRILAAFRSKGQDEPPVTELRQESDFDRGRFLRLVVSGDEHLKAVPMHITVLSDRDSWLNEYLPRLLLNWLEQGLAVRWIHFTDDLVPGDVCFLLGCGQMLKREHLEMHRHNLVVHESDLPKGRGWSPLTWQVLEGADRIPVTLFEADAKVDNGSIYLQTWIELNGSELVDELREHQARATLDLCRIWVKGYPAILSQARPQEGEATSYRRRTTKDSELDPGKPLGDQFNLLRVVDNRRYPAFFTWRGSRYVIDINKDELST